MIKKEVTDISAGIVLLLFALAGYALSMNLVDVNSTAKYGPDFFPKLILATLAIFAIVLVVSGAKKIRNSKSMLGINKTVVFNIFLFILILIGYIMLFFTTGFIISTVVFLLIGQWVFGIRKIPVVIVTTITIPIALFFVFTVFFKIPLP